MKIVATILQCRRAVLPHVFVQSILPEMRKRVDGEVECVIVQHRGDASGGNHNLESNRWDPGRLDLVKEWTEAGRYDGATIIEHDINYPPYPSIPGFHLCVKEALERKADFHLWLEDDAIVNDLECGDWDKLLGGREVGVYRKYHHLNPAFMVTRPSFDERMVKRLEDYEWWKWSRRLEPKLRENMRTKRKYLKMEYAVRYHHKYYPWTGLRYVADALRQWAPDKLPLLDADFGEGAAQAAPMRPEEIEEHLQMNSLGLTDRLWHLRTALVEKYLLPENLS